MYKCKVCEKQYKTPPSTFARGKVTCSRECSYVLRGRTKSNDLLGSQFGRLKVLVRLPSLKNKVRWLCECDCGNQVSVSAGDLTRTDRRAYRSCGCQQREMFFKNRPGRESYNWKSPNDISMSYWNAVRRSAARRSFSFEITIEQAFDIFINQSGLCALTGQPIELNITASLDRIDSNIGYTIENIQWLDKRVNNLKSNWDEKEFIDFCRKVVKHADRD